MKKMFLLLTLSCSIIFGFPEISSFRLYQETECNDSNLVFIDYILVGDEAKINMKMSADSGLTWLVDYETLYDSTGDLSYPVLPDTHSFVWDLGCDTMGLETDKFCVELSCSGGVALADTNLLENPGFEYGFDYWTTYASCTIENPGHFSDSCFTPDVMDYAGYLFQEWPLIPGESYYFEFYARILTDSLFGQTVEIIRDWYSGCASMGSRFAFSENSDSVRLTAWLPFPGTGDDTTIFLGEYIDTIIGSWNKYSVFANVSTKTQLFYINDIYVCEIEKDTAFTAQFVLLGAVNFSGWGDVLYDDLLVTYTGQNPRGKIRRMYCYVDSKKPVVNLTVPDSTISGDTLFLDWAVSDLFWAHDICSLYVNSSMVLDTVILTTDTCVSVYIPPMTDESLFVKIAVRDSFCNWGCDSGYIRVVTTGIEEMAKPENLSLQIEPNPFNSACRIFAPLNSKVEIFDIEGHKVGGLTVGKTVWKPEPSVGSGVYLVRAMFGEQNVAKRVVYLK